MSNQEILEKAIQKAIDSGWEDGKSVDMADFAPILEHDPFILPIKGLIFNHDFAKALWGDGFLGKGDATLYKPAWAYHLKEMVIAEDPIKYLGENL